MQFRTPKDSRSPKGSRQPHHMQPRHWVASAIFVALFAAGLTAVQAEGGEGAVTLVAKKRAPGVAPVTNDLYREECGSCHFAYQPGLLPGASWKPLMEGLDNHFGDNAELAPEVQAKLTAFVLENAADNATNRLSQRIMRSAKGAAPRRIGEVPFIRKEHREIPAKMLADNPQVKSLSRCEACHRRAEEGYFNEHSVDIPGFGKWED
ncbi:MAG: diheme cytochrome c [Nitrospirota bacterium]|nr:diheme cytochrome c [Nitrospirota bacterium]